MWSSGRRTTISGSGSGMKRMTGSPMKPPRPSSGTAWASSARPSPRTRTGSGSTISSRSGPPRMARSGINWTARCSASPSWCATSNRPSAPGTSRSSWGGTPTATCTRIPSSGCPAPVARSWFTPTTGVGRSSAAPSRSSGTAAASSRRFTIRTLPSAALQRHA